MWFSLARFWIRRGQIKCVALVHTSCLGGHSAQQESLAMLLTSANVLAATKLIAVGAPFFSKRVTESKERCRYWTLVLLQKTQGVCCLEELSLSFLLLRATGMVAHTLTNPFRQMLHLSRTRTMRCSPNIDLATIVGEKYVANELLTLQIKQERKTKWT